MLKNKSGKVSFTFIIILIACLFIWFYFKDVKTAAIVFVIYVIVKIVINFIRGRER